MVICDCGPEAYAYTCLYCGSYYDAEPYCDYCETSGHTYRFCPMRDDIFYDN
jgi:hypothetical protein